jgi:molybdate-binding protein
MMIGLKVCLFSMNHWYVSRQRIFQNSEITIDQLSTFDFLAREKGSGTRMYVDTIMSANGIN